MRWFLLKLHDASARFVSKHRPGRDTWFNWCSHKRETEGTFYKGPFRGPDLSSFQDNTAIVTEQDDNRLAGSKVELPCGHQKGYHCKSNLPAQGIERVLLWQPANQRHCGVFNTEGQHQVFFTIEQCCHLVWGEKERRHILGLAADSFDLSSGLVGRWCLAIPAVMKHLE